jgi:hypothetical protein
LSTISQARFAHGREDRTGSLVTRQGKVLPTSIHYP